VARILFRRTSESIPEPERSKAVDFRSFWRQQQWQYICSSGSVMGNNTGSSNATDVRQQAQHWHKFDAEDQCDVSIVKHC